MLNKKNFFAIVIVLISIVKFYSQNINDCSSAEVLLHLNKLYDNPKVLYIAAHPDDENTRLISYLASKLYYRTAYLSLTRGAGGQNLIGSKKAMDLGVLRTQELLAARRIDGGEQFFTRAYDFGYSKSLEETLEKWNEDSILQDIVFVIRYFQPDVIITRFDTDGSGGHGHHTASAVLAQKAFQLAANPKSFPEQLQVVKVWQAKRLLHNSTLRFRNPDADMSHLLAFNVGDYQPLLGLTTGEIASMSRSMHKSQGFGVLNSYGENFEYFKPLLGDTANLKNPFERLDKENKEFPSATIQKAIQIFDAQNPEIILPELQKLHAHFLQSQDKYRKEMVEKLMLIVCGVKIFWLSQNEYCVANSDNPFVLKMVHHSSKKISLKGLQYSSGKINGNNSPLSLNPILEVERNKFVNVEHKIFFDFNAISQPYWLQQEPTFIYALNNSQVLSTPDEQKHRCGLLSIEIDGYSFSVPLELTHHKLFPDKGEVVQPLHIIPPVSLQFAKKVFSVNSEAKKNIEIVVKSWTKEKQSVNVNMQFIHPNKTKTVKYDNVPLNEFEQKVIRFSVTPPPAKKSNPTIHLKAYAEHAGVIYPYDMSVISYDHIPKQLWFPEVKSKLISLYLPSIQNTKIAYIIGSGDEVPSGLKEVGYHVTFLNPSKIEQTDLSVFKCVILGIRAFNVHPSLMQSKKTLWKYAENGGTLIIQYNTNNWLGKMEDSLTPYYFHISRNRVTDENSPMQFLQKEHPIFKKPFTITEEDFHGWVQERGVYFSDTADARWQKPLAFKDFNESFDNGSLLVCHYGKGAIFYTGLSFFRQIPAGVIGAFKLLINCMEYKP